LGGIKYDYFLSKKTYLLAQASGESDLNALLDLRTTVGVGVGYQFREDESWKISGEAGLSYVDENYEGNADDSDFLAARLAYKADWKASDKWEVGQAGQIYPSLEDKEDVNALVDTHAKVTLTKNMFLQLQWLFTWDNTPASGTERVDDLYLLTLGWSF
jgi:putative salt-induced outer membrane protein YdiY